MRHIRVPDLHMTHVKVLNLNQNSYLILTSLSLFQTFQSFHECIREQGQVNYRHLKMRLHRYTNLNYSFALNRAALVHSLSVSLKSRFYSSQGRGKRKIWSPLFSQCLSFTYSRTEDHKMLSPLSLQDSNRGIAACSIIIRSIKSFSH